MIQRIQTLYLLIIAALMAVTLFSGLAWFAGDAGEFGLYAFGLKTAEGELVQSTVYMGILLALAGGFMDAYSYMARGHVFANAQTGNILLFAVAVSEGRPGDSLRYLLPVVSFAVGIALTAAIRTRFGRMSRLHWPLPPKFSSFSGSAFSRRGSTLSPIALPPSPAASRYRPSAR